MKPIIKYVSLGVATTLLIGVGYYYWSYSKANNAQTEQTKVVESQAAESAPADPLFEAAMQKLAKRGLYDTPARQECLIFDSENENTEVAGQNEIDIVIRELHDESKNCPGDPNVAPFVARYRIALEQDQIAVYDPAEADYQPLSECDVLAYQAFARPVQYTERNLSRMQVSQPGRSYFHSAPDAQCKQANKFIVGGDKLEANYQFKQYTYVHYTHPKTSERTYGWILTSDLVALTDSKP